MEKVVEMVTIHFAFLVIIVIFAFSVGKTFGRIETSIIFNRKLTSIISALKKVNQIAALRGEDIAKMSTEEIVRRTENQLKIKDGDE